MTERRELCGGRAVVHRADCLDAMREMPDASIDAVVCDPPYGLKFMGKEWDHGVPGTAYWREALRVAKPGSHLLAFGGTRTFHRVVSAIEDAGWEIRDTIIWIHGQGFPKSLDVAKQFEQSLCNLIEVAPGKKVWLYRTDGLPMRLAPPFRHPMANRSSGWGTALKPAFEPICLARKPLIGTVAENVLAHGTGGINVDGCRIAGEPWKAHCATGLARDKFFTKGPAVEIEKEPHALGRWPSNIIHDGSDEVVGMFPTASGSAARFFYSAKASRAEREAGCEMLPMRGGKARNHHPTIKPLALMRYLCRLVTPPGGLVLDPFMGSGTTGCAALLEGFRFVGMDLDAESVEIASARIAHWGGLEDRAAPLFAAQEGGA